MEEQKFNPAARRIRMMLEVLGICTYSELPDWAAILASTIGFAGGVARAFILHSI